MLIEMWQDKGGFRFRFEDSEFDLTAIAFQQLIDSLSGFLDQSMGADDEGLYESLQLDLEDHE